MIPDTRAETILESKSAPRHWNAGAIVALILAGAVACVVSVSTEHGFPYWDFSAYHQETLRGADRIGEFLSGGDVAVPLYSLPLVPWVLVFGEGRQAFVLGVYFLFFVPYLFALASISRRVWPADPSAPFWAVSTGLLTPACWTHVLQGYPDIGGATLMAACVLLYGAYAREGDIAKLLQIGLLAGLAVVFRRHYIYAVIALYGGIGVDLVLFRPGFPRTVALRHALRVLVSAAVAVAIIAYLTPQFFGRALQSGGEMAPYQHSIAVTLLSMLFTIGCLPLLLSVAGWWRASKLGDFCRPELRVVAAATIAWIAVWALHARQQPFHYPHWLPLATTLGLTSLVIRRAAQRSSFRRLAVAGVAAVLGLGWVLTMPVFSFRIPVLEAAAIYPSPAQRATNAAYDSIAGLVRALREQATPGDGILVGASSYTLNFDILRNAEQQFFGRRGARLNVFESPQTNAQGTPAHLLAAARFVVLAEPFQHHLGVADQKVVQVIGEAFTGQWPIASDFEALPQTFVLPDGGNVRIMRRVAPSTPAVAADTARRMDAFVYNRSGGQAWLVDSRFPNESTGGPDGSFRVTAHPVRGSEPRQTRLEFAGERMNAADVSATVQFLDDRCHGIRVVARLTDTTGPAEEVEVGVFVPVHNNAAWRASLPSLHGRALTLEIQSHPSSREEIDYCTVMLKDLRVSAR